jgi:hypothetical protein
LSCELALVLGRPRDWLDCAASMVKVKNARFETRKRTFTEHCPFQAGLALGQSDPKLPERCNSQVCCHNRQRQRPRVGLEEGALWLPESDPHDLAAQKRDAETQKQRIMTILATVMPSAGVRRPRMSPCGGKATRTSCVVRVLSDEVLRFRGERSGGALSPSGSRQPWSRRCLLGKQICGLHDYGSLRVTTAQIARKAGPRAKSGIARETELREPQSGRFLGPAQTT